MALVKIKFYDGDKEEEIEVEQSEVDRLQFDENVCTPGEEKCISGVKMKCKKDGSAWFKIGTC